MTFIYRSDFNLAFTLDSMYFSSVSIVTITDVKTIPVFFTVCGFWGKWDGLKGVPYYSKCVFFFPGLY